MTQHYGRPGEGVHALQIEINRALYMDEASLARGPGFANLAAAEAMVEGHAPGSSLTPAEAVQISKEQSGKALPFSGQPVAFVFGPESGAVS